MSNTVTHIVCYETIRMVFKRMLLVFLLPAWRNYGLGLGNLDITPEIAEAINHFGDV